MPEILSANSVSPESNGVLVAFEAIMSRMTRFSEKSSLMSECSFVDRDWPAINSSYLEYLVDQFQQKYSARFTTL